MKRLLTVIMFTFLFVGLVNSNAQKRVVAVQSPMYIGAEAGLSIPMGDFGDAADMGFGASGIFQYYFTPDVALHATLGYYYYSTKVSGLSASDIPLTAGIIYELNKGGMIPYIGALIGFHFVSASYKDAYYGQTYTSSDTKFGFSPIFGLIFPMSPTMDFHANAKLNIVSDWNSFGIYAGLRWKL
jgi:hypothetical protein